MRDLTIELENRPGALAEMGEALGGAGVSVKGGGVFVHNGTGVAHFLFADGIAARRALEAAGVNIEVMYSDHDHQLILVVDDPAKGRKVSETWSSEQ